MYIVMIRTSSPYEDSPSEWEVKFAADTGLWTYENVREIVEGHVKTALTDAASFCYSPRVHIKVVGGVGQTISTEHDLCVLVERSWNEDKQKVEGTAKWRACV